MSDHTDTSNRVDKLFKPLFPVFVAMCLSQVFRELLSRNYRFMVSLEILNNHLQASINDAPTAVQKECKLLLRIASKFAFSLGGEIDDKLPHKINLINAQMRKLDTFWNTVVTQEQMPDVSSGSIDKDFRMWIEKRSAMEAIQIYGRLQGDSAFKM